MLPQFQKLIPVLAMTSKNIMSEQMTDYVNRNNPISPFQSGFRPGHSAMIALVGVSVDICLNLELNQPTILLLLDFSKGFDSVCHGLLIFKLRQRYGFHTLVVALVLSYLFPRHQRVNCGDDFSSLALLMAGVPQGSLISPLSCSQSVFGVYSGRFLGPLPPPFLNDDFSPYVYIRLRTLVLIYKLSWGDHGSTVCRKVYGSFAGPGDWRMLPRLLFVCNLLLPS
jgi:hypothetical protein